MKRLFFIFGILFLTILVAACNTSQCVSENIQAQTSSGNVVSVSIKDFKFVPSEASIKVGDTVVWTNDDNAAHTVESTDRTLKSDELSHGDTYKHTFTKAGTYNYICGIHPSMKGSVTVQ
mgnify:CR=1 FL=1